MGIEPTRAVRPEPENKPFGANANSKCDKRCEFWRYLGLSTATKGYIGMRSPGLKPFGRRSPIRQLGTQRLGVVARHLPFADCRCHIAIAFDNSGFTGMLRMSIVSFGDKGPA